MQDLQTFSHSYAAKIKHKPNTMSVSKIRLKLADMAKFLILNNNTQESKLSTSNVKVLILKLENALTLQTNKFYCAKCSGKCEDKFLE